jgi:hypothetical protein
MDFDPYREWLKIPADRRPPGPHDLLGLRPGETDPERIQQAARRRYDLVRRYRLGEHAAEAQRLLNELGEATASLLAPKGANALEKRAIEEMVEEWLGSTQQGGREFGVAASAEAWDFQGAAPGDSWGPFPDSTEFDPYFEWFDVPESRRPPNSYELLGLPNGETDGKRIREAAVERSARLRRHVSGPHGDQAKRLIAEVADATADLLRSKKDARSKLRIAPAVRQACDVGTLGPFLAATAGAVLAAAFVHRSVDGTPGLFLSAITAYLIVGPFSLHFARKIASGEAADVTMCITVPPCVAFCLLLLPAFPCGTILSLMALFKLHQLLTASLEVEAPHAIAIFLIYHLLSLITTALVSGVAIIAPRLFS